MHILKIPFRETDESSFIVTASFLFAKTSSYTLQDLIETLQANPQPTEFLKPVLQESDIQCIDATTCILDIETKPYHFLHILEEIKHIAQTYHSSIYKDIIDPTTTLVIYAYTEGDDFESQAKQVFG